MLPSSFDVIVGVHSTAEAISNPKREWFELVTTDEGMQDLIARTKLDKKLLPQEKLRKLNSHALQEEAKARYSELGVEFQRVPSGVFLVATPLESYDLSWIYARLEGGGKVLKLLALDQVTDIHNGAAMMRTAAFYGIDAIIISSKGSFGTGPSFNRIASGATEHIAVIKCASLSRALLKLQELGVRCIGLSEHATLSDLASIREKSKNNETVCLVLGAEDVGLSHAVMRVVNETMSIKPQGKIKSLNVSVAAAIAMEKIFG